MTQITRIALFLALLAGTLAPALAQNIRKVPDVSIERELVVDADGLKQFAEIELPECPECHGRKVWECRVCKEVDFPHCAPCDGTKKAPCITCCGTGKMVDPIAFMHCPSCDAIGWVRCQWCSGFGSFNVGPAGGPSVETKCLGCKGKGFYQCAVCEGEQKIAPIPIDKDPIAEAESKDLQEALEVLTALDAELSPWEPDERASKSDKALAKMFKKPVKVLTYLEPFREQQEELVKGMTKSGAAYPSFQARMTNFYLNNRNRMVHLVRYQKRVVELYLERALFNENVK